MIIILKLFNVFFLIVEIIVVKSFLKEQRPEMMWLSTRRMTLFVLFFKYLIVGCKTKVLLVSLVPFQIEIVV